MDTLRTKSQQIRDFVTGMLARDFHPGDVLPTEMELAARLGVNRMTVAKVMKQLKAEGYIERRQKRGTLLIKAPAVSRQTQDLVLVVVPDYARNEEGTDPFFTPLLGQLLGCLHRERLRALCVTCDPEEELTPGAFVGECAREQLRGVLCAYTFLDRQAQLRAIFSGLGVPTVWLGTPAIEPSDSCVEIDDYTGAKRAAEHLLASGYRRVGFLSCQLDTEAKKRRLEGFRAAHAAEGVSLKEENLVVIGTEGNLQQAGRLCAETIIAKGLDFDALFVCDNGIVEGMEMFRQEHARAHKLFALPIATFDAGASHPAPRIVCSVVQPLPKLCRTAIEKLQDLVVGKKNAEAGGAVILQPDLFFFNR